MDRRCADGSQRRWDIRCGVCTLFVRLTLMSFAEKTIALQTGSDHTFKFIVDGEWKYDRNLPWYHDPDGNINNFIHVGAWESMLIPLFRTLFVYLGADQTHRPTPQDMANRARREATLDVSDAVDGVHCDSRPGSHASDLDGLEDDMDRSARAELADEYMISYGLRGASTLKRYALAHAAFNRLELMTLQRHLTSPHQLLPHKHHEHTACIVCCVVQSCDVGQVR